MRFFRNFLLILFSFISLCFGEVLDKDAAFKFALNLVNSGFELKIDFDKSVYLYSDKLRILANDKELNAMLDFPLNKDNKFDESFDIFIPLGLLQSFGKNEINIITHFQGCSHSGFCYAPMKSEFKLDLSAKKVLSAELNKIETSTQNTQKLSSNDEKIANDINKKTLFWVMLSFFGYGLLLSLTPCVLPMVPIVSAIIVAKTSKNHAKKAGFLVSLEYVLAMSVANALLGVLAASIGAGLHGYLQNPFVIAVGSFVFVLLALLIFGFGANHAFFTKLNTILDSKARAYSGHFGVIFMGFISALILSPCVAAPLAGALLYIANSGNIALGALCLFVLSLGAGIPLLALGAGISILPRPGEWMEKITQIFGFIMLGMAIWLLSRIISQNLVWLLYGVLSIFAAVFLTSNANAKYSKFFNSISAIIAAFGVGFIIAFVLNFTGVSENSRIPNFQAKKVENLKELENIVKSAKKPLLIDFYADWCVNCKEFENELKSDKTAQNMLLEYEKIIIDFTQMNEQKEAILKNFNLFGPPAFLVFTNGELRGKIAAAPSISEFKEFLENSK